MTHSDLHMAVRDVLRGTRLEPAFWISIRSTELHPGRVHVEYTIHIAGLSRDYKSASPQRLLAWVRMAVKSVVVDEAPPPALLAIGLPPRLRRVK